MERENRNLKVLVVILCVMVLGLGGYFFYDKVFSDDNINIDSNNSVVEDNNNINIDSNNSVVEDNNNINIDSNNSVVEDNNNIQTDMDNNHIYQKCTEVIYYNPITNKKCNNNEDNCYGWYVLSDDNNNNSNIELILNKNLGDTVALNENETPKEGPITALNYLNSMSKEWNVEVRMPSVDDVANVLGVEKNSDGNIGVVEVPECLYSNGESSEYWDGGYWLSDYVEGKPIFIIDCTRGLISAGNQFIKSSASNSSSWGVRPVIKVDKNNLD